MENDTTAPTLVAVGALANLNSLRVAFSEPLEAASAQAAANYSIPGGVFVTAARLSAPVGSAGDHIVVLWTTARPEGASLMLTVRNVKDATGNAIAANSTIGFLTPVFARGWATYERWDKERGDPGGLNAFAAAIADGSMRLPDFSATVTQFGAPWGVRDLYYARVSGFFLPPASDNYVFFIAADDQSILYLGTGETASTKRMIARETAWSNQYEFTTSSGQSDLTAKRSDQFASSEWPTGPAIALTGGRKILSGSPVRGRGSEGWRGCNGYQGE